jgi:exopolysaccharide biosynthesis polyprenyl glycosylphosphotransferase
MTTGHPDATLGEARLPLHAGAGRPAVAEPTIRQQVLACRLLGDVGALLLGLMVAQGIQQALLALGGRVQPLGPVTVFNGLAILIWLALFANAGLYDARRLVNAADEFKLILQAVATGTVAAVFTAFFLKVPTQRSWVLATWIACSVAVLATRFTYRQILNAMRRSGTLVSRLLIVGAGREGRDLYRAVRRAPSLGFQVVGFVDDEARPGLVAAGLPEVVGSIDDLPRLSRSQDVNAILIARSSVSEATAERVYRHMQDLPVDVHLSTGLLGLAANRLAVQRFGDAPVLGLRPVALTGLQQTLKRAFDLVAAGLILTALIPVFLVCAIAVRLGDGGPVFFRQERVGRDGRTFLLHKFRSMTTDAETQLAKLVDRYETQGPHFKLRGDPRITPVGRVLRAWSLDELPQLLDVLRGDMSLVGPRPLQRAEARELEVLVPPARLRLKVKPGISGLWQVSGRSDLSFADRVHYDLFYVENWSLAMDLFIVLRTIPTVLRRTGI